MMTYLCMTYLTQLCGLEVSAMDCKSVVMPDGYYGFHICFYDNDDDNDTNDGLEVGGDDFGFCGQDGDGDGDKDIKDGEDP